MFVPNYQYINFKNISDDLKYAVSLHKQINSYGLGDTDQLSYWTQLRDSQPNPTFESPIYPLLYVVPGRVTNGLRYKEWFLNLICADLLQGDLVNQVDVLSDTLQMLQDILSQYRLSVTSEFGCFNNFYYLDESTPCIPFLDKYDDSLNGWNAELKIKTMTPLDRCEAAFEVFTGTPIVHESINFKTFHDDFRLLADHHKQINSFGFGALDDLSYWTESRLKMENTTFESPFFPLLYVIPGNATTMIDDNGSSYTEYEFNCIVMDILDRDLTNQIDVLSDTNQILDDIISQFRLSVTDSLGCFNAKYYLDEFVECNPFLEQYSDLCGGWSGNLRIKVMMPLDRCAAAFNSFVTTPSVTPSVTPTISLTPSITASPTVTPSITSSATPTITPTVTPTSSGLVFTGLTFLVSSGTTKSNACNNYSLGNTFNVYAQDLGFCGPCVPLTCWPCLMTSQQVYLDQAFTIPVPDGWYTNDMLSGNFGSWNIIGGFPQPAGFQGGCP